MRRVLLLLGLLLIVPAAAHGASVRTVACVPALDQATRSATFEARVKAVGGTDRMQVRFALQTRAEGASAWRRVAAPGFDTWLSSEPGVRRYTYARTIRNLAAPASYRTSVRFRWLDADGDTVRTRRDTSPTCRQPDLRPDLSILGVEVLPGPGGDRTRYAVTVRNDGRTGAAPFDVGLAVAETELGPLPVFGLAAGARRTVTVAGPACTPDAAPTAIADVAGAVDERDEDDNVLVASCAP
jgi:hypothetical protein